MVYISTMKYLDNYIRTENGFMVNGCRMYDENSPMPIFQGFWLVTNKGWKSLKKVIIPISEGIEIDGELQISDSLAEYLVSNYRNKYKTWTDPNIEHSNALKHKALCEYITDPRDNG